MAQLEVISKSIDLMKYTYTVTGNHKRYPRKYLILVQEIQHSWDCDDGLPYPENGCEDFVLDKSTLSDEEQRIFILNEILRGEQNE